MEKNINEQIDYGDSNDLDAWIDDNKTYPDKEIQRILKKII